MLAPDDRELLSTSLQPPVGYHLVEAVGTTFTLDLDALLLVPLTFAGLSIRDDHDPIEVLQSLRTLGDRLDLYCQAGMIRAPGQLSALTALLAPVVREVNRPRPGRLFHPKTWLLRYRDDEGAESFRLLVLTRNLTFDRSWDLVVRLDGTPERRVQEVNEDLRRFLLDLPRHCRDPLPEPSRARIESLAQEVKRVAWELPDGVRGLSFFPLGIKGLQYRPAELFDGRRQLVVSPYATSDALAEIADACTGSETTVVSRPDDLARLDGDLAERLDLRALDPAAQLDLHDSDRSTETSGPPSVLGALHAKCYVVEHANQSWVYVGSANATGAAFGGNVEFLCALVGGVKQLGIDQFLDAGGLGGLLEPFEPGEEQPPEPDDIEWRLDQVLVDLAEHPFRMSVAPADDGWVPTVAADTIPRLSEDVQVTIALANATGDTRSLEPQQTFDVAFGPRPLAEVTPLLRIEAELGGVRRSTLVFSSVSGLPEVWSDEILAHQLDTPEKFIRFIVLLLALADGTAPDATVLLPGAGSWTHIGPSGDGLLELLVRAVATQPEAIARLEAIVGRLRSTERAAEVLPAGWEQVWSVVLAAHRKLGPEAVGA